jgi:hypothetical protein
MKQILTALEMNEAFVHKSDTYEAMTLEKQSQAWEDLKSNLLKGNSFKSPEDLEALSMTLKQSHGWEMHHLLAYFDITNGIWGNFGE